MNTGKTLFAQLMDFLPWTTFARYVARYDGDKGVRPLTCAEQFRVMAFAQLTYRESLRDIEVCLSAQTAKLYHMGFREPIRRSTLANANESRNWLIHADFAQRLIGQARALYASEDLGLELSNTVYALDSTTIDLCLSVFPWAHFRATKAAVKMHTLLDLRGNIPSFIHVSEGKLHDVHALDLLVPEPGAIYVMDRGYVDFGRLHMLHLAGAFFVTRTKSNMDFHRLYSTKTDRNTGIICDQTIALDGFYTKQDYPTHLRRVRFKDPETGKTLVFLTNQMTLPAATIARSTRTAGRWNCSSSGSSSIFGSSAFSAPQRMRSRRKSGSPCRSTSLSPSSRSASTSTPRSTLCYRSCRSLCSRRCPCSKPFRAATPVPPTSPSTNN